MSDPSVEIQTRASKIREAFIDSIWMAAGIFGLEVLIAIPLRAIQIQHWTWATTINGGLATLALLAFPFRRRLDIELQAALPIMLLGLGGVIDTVRNGLQENGLSYLLIANVLAAMLFSRRIAIGMFVATCAILVATAIGFATHLLHVRANMAFASSGLSWTFAIATVFGLGFVVLMGVLEYRESFQELTEHGASQIKLIAHQRDEIASQAHRDPLTGLPSLVLAQDRLQHEFHNAVRNGAQIGLLFIDLDDFKAVNDTFGHQAGDHVLKMVASRISATLRSADTAARLGGDEFLVILAGKVDADAASQVAGKLVSAITLPIPYDNKIAQVGASIGIALYPDHADSPAQLLHCADLAMYQAKQSGKNRWSLYRSASQAAEEPAWWTIRAVSPRRRR